MHHAGERRGGADGVPLTFVLPLLPGQAEPWRRCLQELQASRRAAFEAARRRWGLRSLTLWLAPSRPVDLVVVQLEMTEDLADALERCARSLQPFDQWITERARELHGIDLCHGIARYRAERLGVWPQQAPPMVEEHATASPAGWPQGSDTAAPHTQKQGQNRHE